MRSASLALLASILICAMVILFSGHYCPRCGLRGFLRWLLHHGRPRRVYVRLSSSSIVCHAAHATPFRADVPFKGRIQSLAFSTFACSQTEPTSWYIASRLSCRPRFDYCTVRFDSQRLSKWPPSQVELNTVPVTRSDTITSATSCGLDSLSRPRTGDPKRRRPFCRM